MSVWYGVMVPAGTRKEVIARLNADIVCILGQPEVVLEGIPGAAADGEDMMEIVLDAIDGTLRSIPAKRRGDLDMVSDAVTRCVRGAINGVWGKKPIVKVLMTVVEAKG